jgi:hypothetical protein
MQKADSPGVVVTTGVLGVVVLVEEVVVLVVLAEEVVVLVVGVVVEAAVVVTVVVVVLVAVERGTMVIVAAEGAPMNVLPSRVPINVSTTLTTPSGPATLFGVMATMAAELCPAEKDTVLVDGSAA